MTTDENIAIGKIPQTKQLCDLLGYGPSSERRYTELTKTTHAWRRSWTTELGKLGKTLYHWYAADVKNNLTRMTEEYLEIGGYGKQYWPALNQSSLSPTLQYPRDKPK